MFGPLLVRVGETWAVRRCVLFCFVDCIGIVMAVET